MKDLTPIAPEDVVLQHKELQRELGLGHAWGVSEKTNIISEEREKRKQIRYEKCLPVAHDILEDARSSLAVRFRFLDRALWRMPLIPSREIYGLASDGISFYYDPEYVVDRFKLSGNEIIRDVIHCLFHCIFRHPFMLYSVMREPWDVACDIAIESMLIDLIGEAYPCNYDRRAKEALRIISAQVGGVVTAERLYHFFSNEGNRADLRSLAPIFRHDSHGLWYGSSDTANEKGKLASGKRPTSGENSAPMPTTENSQLPNDFQNISEEQQLEQEKDNDERDNGQAGSEQQTESNDTTETQSNSSGKPDEDSNSSGDAQDSGNEPDKSSSEEELAEQWEEISRQIQIELETTFALRGDQAGSLIEGLQAVNREKYNYEEFLKRFAVLRERMRINPDEFDYIYYTFGLKHYGNLPLIEPLEYKESRAISDFVIAIDTSESCSGSLVQAFIRKTFNILSQKENFHHRVNIHIIQCDAQIQEDTKIESLDQLDLYLERMELKGFGGTDFRPVFNYVNLLNSKGEFSDLRGLIYFTDGLGEFPKQQPKYDAVFVFLDDGYSNPEVPPWALSLILDERELVVPQAKKQQAAKYISS